MKNQTVTRPQELIKDLLNNELKDELNIIKNYNQEIAAWTLPRLAMLKDKIEKYIGDRDRIKAEVTDREEINKIAVALSILNTLRNNEINKISLAVYCGQIEPQYGYILVRVISNSITEDNKFLKDLERRIKFIDFVEGLFDNLFLIVDKIKKLVTKVIPTS